MRNPLAILVAVAAAGVTVLLRARPQLATAGGALVWLGFIWATVAASSSIAVCDLAPPAEARVVEAVQLQERRIRFVAEFSGGCRAQVLADRFAGLREGDMVRLAAGEIQSLADVSEYSPGYARYLERQGISATWLYPDTAIVRREENRLQRWHEAVRHRVTTLFVEPDASLVLAILFAERGTLPEEIVQQFRATGVSHVLAISGLHVSLLTGMLLGLMLLLPVGSRMRTALVLALLWLYIAFIGAPTSAVRAASFWTVTLTALRLHLLVSLPTVLFLAVGALASLQPKYLSDVGFQLSVSAVAGIFLALFLTKPYVANHKPFSRGVLQLVLVSLGATVATGPLVAYHFGNVALAGIVVNLLVVPLFPALLVFAIASLLSSPVFMPAALLAALLLHWVIIWINFVTRVISAMPGVFFADVTVPWWFIPLYYLVFAAASMWLLRCQGRKWREVWAP
jgi:competence protein ComEC